MKYRLICLFLLLITSGCATIAERDYPHRSVPFTDVKLTGDFWRLRIEIKLQEKWAAGLHEWRVR